MPIHHISTVFDGLALPTLDLYVLPGLERILFNNSDCFSAAITVLKHSANDSREQKELKVSCRAECAFKYNLQLARSLI